MTTKINFAVEAKGLAEKQNNEEELSKQFSLSQSWQEINNMDICSFKVTGNFIWKEKIYQLKIKSEI